MSLMSLPNLKYLEAKAEEWKTLQLILQIESPEARWQLLQIWLNERSDWQQIIQAILQTPDNAACLKLILDKLEIPETMLSFFDGKGLIRQGAAHYISVIKALYLDRIQQPKLL